MSGRCLPMSWMCRAMGKKAGGKKEEKQTRHGLPTSQCMLQVFYLPTWRNLFDPKLPTTTAGRNGKGNTPNPRAV